MNILFILFSDFAGPGEKQFYFLGNELVKKGHKVLMLVPGNPDSIQDIGNEPFFQVEKLRYFGTSLHSETLRHIKSFSPDIVHSHFIRNICFRAALTVKKLFGIPLIVHHDDAEMAIYEMRFKRKWEAVLSHGLMFAGTYIYPPLWRWYNPYLRKREKQIDAHDCLTSELKEYLLKTKGWKARHIYLGLDLDFINIKNGSSQNTHITKDKFVLMYNGGLHRALMKDFEMMMKMLVILVKKHQNIELYHSGMIWHKNKFEEMVEQYSLKNHVKFLGYVPTVKHLLNHFEYADVFVQPGHYNEFNLLRLPSKLQFYLAAGKPIVTFSFGFGKILKNNVNAFLYNEDTSEAMAERVYQVLNNKKLRLEVGENARKIAEEIFDVELTANEFLDLYSSCDVKMERRVTAEV